MLPSPYDGFVIGDLVIIRIALSFQAIECLQGKSQFTGSSVASVYFFTFIFHFLMAGEPS